MLFGRADAARVSLGIAAAASRRRSIGLFPVVKVSVVIALIGIVTRSSASGKAGIAGVCEGASACGRVAIIGSAILLGPPSERAKGSHGSFPSLIT